MSLSSIDADIEASLRAIAEQDHTESFTPEQYMDTDWDNIPINFNSSLTGLLY